MGRFIWLCLLCSWANTSYAVSTLYVAKEQRVLYDRDLYLYELLDRALIAAQFDAKVEHIQVHPHQQRTLLALSRGEVDLHWSMTSPEREQLAIAIQVPLFKGFIGKRALLVNRAHLSRFEKIQTKAQLAKLTAVQGHDWPDTKILAFNDLPVRPMSKYQAMFAMVARGKVDYFPRSFIEVGSELAERQNDDLVILPNLYLYYPSAFYFFVSKKKPEVANALKKGLALMQQNGEFDMLFEQYFAAKFNALPMQDARVITLRNPYFENN
ncbi:transporter substrate-binding domain-containing protein [Pseudoalteromonas sp. MMG013]|uniref:substrate-binding periplasmic protein n=1 Tax=unclassified Pseudoalteromonas TaxID=194690 RepID=UPI001B365550|nr:MULTISPECIES: transporter substrate-binding domain-containing protein [unclassified Pseudoalteromonas]MBQ4848551.1 transporter substrate-binding domain-containing protein [Pseudoalteromonas sp. MMG012]MBQ4861241.1 transporter substrate-binding domain-containing protein [Pseudoalteromonas sp. MMG013]